MGPGRRLGNEHNLDAFDTHPAYGVVCDFRDDQIHDAPTPLRLEAAIDHAYDTDSLGVCNESWGGIDGVTAAKHLVEQCYLFDTDGAVFPEPY